MAYRLVTLSLILGLASGCSLDRSGLAPVTSRDGGPIDGGPVDGGPVDGGPSDGGPVDGGPSPCIPADCNDGDPCTTDVCDDGTCTHTPHSGPCDDGVFCNGVDTCQDGVCQHAGDPCEGSLSNLLCDEERGMCAGCLVDADCPTETVEHGDCVGAATCDLTGQQRVQVTAYACVTGMCVPQVTSRMQSCTRATDGLTCAPSTTGAWSTCLFASCGGGAMPERSRTITEFTCGGGVCNTSSRTETEACRTTASGRPCSPSPTCEDWNACRAETPSSACSGTGVQWRTCRGACAYGSCSGMETFTDWRSCTVGDESVCVRNVSSCTACICTPGATRGTRTCDAAECDGTMCRASSGNARYPCDCP